MQKILPKSDYQKFLSSLINSYQVIAPTSKEPTSFQKISSLSETASSTQALKHSKLTEVPFKQNLIPEEEILLEFKEGKSKEIISKSKETIIFGLRKCDLNAIQILDKVMYDPQYLEKRKSLTLIGMFCETPDEYCFCNSMKLEDYYDIFIYPKGKNYILDIKTEKGEKLTKNLKVAKKKIPIPIPKNSKSLKNLDIAKNYKDSIWKADASKCLSCSACTVYCPTCNCYDIKDTLNLNLKDGKRVRRQTSCQLKSFSKVAGGKSYRDSRVSRFKHFVYHKISYFESQHNRPMCTGCGRCLRVCPTKIDWVKTINKLPKNKK